MRHNAVVVSAGRVKFNEGTDSTIKPPPRTRTWGMKRSIKVAQNPTPVARTLSIKRPCAPRQCQRSRTRNSSINAALIHFAKYPSSPPILASFWYVVPSIECGYKRDRLRL